MRDKIKKLMPGWLLNISKQIRYCCIVCLFHIFHLFPIKKSRIVLCNVWGFGDNAKYVAEELAKRLFEETSLKNSHKSKKETYEVIFITNHPDKAIAPKLIKVIKNNSLKAIYALATAKVWVDNNRKENYIRKRKGQFYIQTWHGGIALKKIEKDYAKHLSSAYIKNAKRDSAMTDLYISNSDFCTRMYKKSFWYQGEILECGSPRNDILVKPKKEITEQVRKVLNIDSNIRILLYAPTYREGKNNTKAYTMNYDKLIQELSMKFGGEWIVAVRLHPLVSGQSEVIPSSKRVINMTHYRDIYELMSASDMLITDYSNIMFEFSFSKKPVLLYATDRAEYDRDRGFYFDYDSLPYYKADGMQELVHGIRTFNKQTYEEAVKEFFAALCIYENGQASKIVADKIISVIKT